MARARSSKPRNPSVKLSDFLVGYKKAIEDHHANSGFDLFYPDETKLCNTRVFIDFKVKAVLLEDTAKPFYLYPRSSISKTPFRMANSVGIIDREYRGCLGAYVDVLTQDAVLEQGVRLFQICSPSLEPFQVEMIPMEEFMVLYANTERGEGGFGSTGR